MLDNGHNRLLLLRNHEITRPGTALAMEALRHPTHAPFDEDLMRSCRFIVVLLPLSLALTACIGETERSVPTAAAVSAPPPPSAVATAAVEAPASAGPAAPDPAVAAPTPEGKRHALVAHEWGTYTSVQASDGTVLAGLQHEDEALPEFVHGRDVTNPYGKGMERRLAEPVTQKLETPVIYFYAAEPKHVRVEIDFPEGVISQWYPDAADFKPAIDQLANLRDGSMTWDVELDPTLGDTDFPAVAPDDVWAPSRDVAATGLRVGGEQERFIFYRGLGVFDVPFRVTATDSALTLTLKDTTADLGGVVILNVDETSGGVVHLGSLRRGASARVGIPARTLPLDAYVAEARRLLQVALEASGLFEDEARAMVDTWSRSYFRTPGLRVLYVAPRAWTDRILPIRFDPAPDELVRTLVGRVEVLTPSAERRVLEVLRDFEATASPSDEPEEALALLDVTLGRFAEPKLHRALAQLGDDPETYGICWQLIELLQTAFVGR